MASETTRPAPGADYPDNEPPPQQLFLPPMIVNSVCSPTVFTPLPIVVTNTNLTTVTWS